jgi:hypothetical protein
MDLLPRIGGVDPYQGGAQQRPGTGAFARKKREEEAAKRKAEAGDDEDTSADFALDPLLAEIDRIRALDPDLTESGQHRALMALRAYQQIAGEDDGVVEALFDSAMQSPAADAAAHVTTRVVSRPPTPPDSTTGSDAQTP